MDAEKTHEKKENGKSRKNKKITTYMKKLSNLKNICLDAQKTRENKSKENIEKKNNVYEKIFYLGKKTNKKRFSRINNQFFREISFVEKTE